MNNKSILLMVSISLNVAFLIALFKIFMAQSNQSIKPTTKPFIAVMHNGMNYSEIGCDSFKMISKTQVITYNNGVTMPIVADEIRIHTNEQ
jgi:hypothetical protein